MSLPNDCKSALNTLYADFRTIHPAKPKEVHNLLHTTCYAILECTSKSELERVRNLMTLYFRFCYTAGIIGRPMYDYCLQKMRYATHTVLMRYQIVRSYRKTQF